MPAYYMPAVFKIVGTQLPQAKYQEAIETASNIAVPESKKMLLELIEADRAVNVDAVVSGDPVRALASLEKVGKILNQLPDEAKWNSPVQVTWEKSKSRNTRLWISLAQHFPENPQVRYFAGMWLSENGYYRVSIEHLNFALSSSDITEAMRKPALKNLGIAMLGLGFTAQAEAALLAALAQPQPDMQVYCILSGIYQLTNRETDATLAENRCPKIWHSIKQILR